MLFCKLKWSICGCVASDSVSHGLLLVLPWLCFFVGILLVFGVRRIRFALLPRNIFFMVVEKLMIG